MTRFAALLLAGCLARSATAQEFRPPDQARGSAQGAGGGGLRVGILGFSTRAGAQVTKDGQAVIGSTLDVVQLGSPRLRLRPSAEAGFGRPEKSLGANLEVIWRVQPETAPAVPYLGAGAGYYDDGATDHVWPTFVLGFELTLRRNTRWLFEYHALDGLRRSRVLIGLAASTGGS